MKSRKGDLRLLKKEHRKRQREAKLIQQILPSKVSKQSNGSVKENCPDSSSPAMQEMGQIKKRKRHKYTVSIALPGSIMLTAQTLEMKTLLASQIARAAAVFGVDEIIVFDEDGLLPAESNHQVDINHCTENLLNNEDKNPAILLAVLLQFMECPQYLRKTLFPQHDILSKTGLMSPLGIPSHAKQDDIMPYREGVVLPTPRKENGKKDKKKRKESNLVDVGLTEPVVTSSSHPVNSRLTIRMSDRESVSRQEPLKKACLYWGYTVRLVNKLSGILNSRCPVLSDSEKESGDSSKYDLIVGTSERGNSVDRYTMPGFKHLLIIFGGVHGLERSLYLDEELTVSSPGELFHNYLNICPKQGSNTIRTEEAIFVTLSALRPHIVQSSSFKN